MKNLFPLQAPNYLLLLTSMLKIVNEVRNEDSERDMFDIFFDWSFKTHRIPAEIAVETNLRNTLIVLCYGHVNASILQKELDYEYLRERSDLNIHLATHNTALISRFIGVGLKPTRNRVKRERLSIFTLFRRIEGVQNVPSAPALWK